MSTTHHSPAPHPAARGGERWLRRRARRRQRAIWLCRALLGVRTWEGATEGVARLRRFGFAAATPERLPTAPDRHVIRIALHVHTTYSDGRGTVAEVAAAARASAMDCVVVADHATLQPLSDGWEGYHHGVLVLFGAEFRTDAGHLLALGLPSGFRAPGRALQSVLAAIRGAGGSAFAVFPAHPFLGWREGTMAGLSGLEVVNLHSLSRQAASTLSLPRLLVLLAAGRATEALRIVTHRPRRELALWDALLAHGRVAALAATDAHGELKWGRRYLPWPSYAQSFRLAQTHLVVPQPLRGNVADDRELVLDALREGRCRLVYRANGDPSGFEFYHAGGRPATEGEEAPWTPDSRICARSPYEHTLFRLYRDGQLVAAGDGASVVHQCERPGAYRLEADLSLHGTGALRWGVRPWLFTNPIYLAGSEGIPGSG